MAHKVTLIPGDGIGPELTEATRRVVEATGVEIEWDVQLAGADVMDQFGGNPLPALSIAGTVVTGQFWGRDPGAPSNTTLSDAIEYVVEL